MPDLFAKTALAGVKPLALAGCSLAEAALGPITSIACFPGTAEAVAARLNGFPAPNTCLTGPLRLWTGPDQAFLVGEAAPDLGALAAVTDQTGGWAALRLDGPGAEAVLARLYPLDLRATAFPIGSCVRAPLGHMQSVLARMEGQGFLILVFRSMARTAWHEIEEAMQKLAARAAAGV